MASQKRKPGRKPKKDKPHLKETYLEAIFQENPIPTYVWKWIGDDFELTNFNNTAITITKGEINKYYGIKASKLYQDLPDIFNSLVNCYLDQSSFEIKMPYRYKSTGEEKYLSVKFVYTTPNFVLIFTSDITHLKLIEKLFINLETEYQEFIDKSPDGIMIIKDAPNQLAFANQALSVMTGYNFQDRKADKNLFIEKIIHEDDRQHFLKIVHQQIIDLSGPEHDEFKGYKKDGSLFYFTATTKQVIYRSEASVMVVIKDTTKTRLAEIAVKKSEEKFRLIAETSVDIIYQTDLEGNVTYCSPAVKNVFGYEPDEIIGEHFSKFLPDSLLPEIQDFASKVAQGKVLRNIQLQVFDKQNRPVYVEVNLTPVYHEGKVINIQGIVRDVSERKQAEQLIKRNAKTLKVLLNASNDIQILVKPDTTILALNDAAAKSIGGKVEKLIGSKFKNNLLPKKVFEKRMEIFRKAIDEKKPKSMQDERDGRFFETTFHPILDERGEVHSIAVYARDITKFKKAEEK